MSSLLFEHWRCGICFPVPTIKRIGPYRVYFHSHEPHEPPHVHADRENFSAKFWLSPVNLARNLGFSPVELRKIRGVVIEHQSEFLEAWHGYFSHHS